MRNSFSSPVYWHDLRGMFFLTSQAVAIGCIIYVIFFGLWLGDLRDAGEVTARLLR